jgi:hypothetical protein
MIVQCIFCIKHEKETRVDPHDTTHTKPNLTLIATY